MRYAHALLLIVLLACGTAMAETKTLKCRGGSMRSIGFKLYANGDNQLVVGFTKGTKPASQGLAKGECSWLNQAMAPADHSALCEKVKDVFLSNTSTDDASYNPPHIFLLETAWSQNAPYLEKALKDVEFSVQVTPGQANCLNVVHIRGGF
jgi:hypothetical protein